MNVLVQMLDAHLMRPRIVSTVRGAAKVAEEVKKRKLPIVILLMSNSSLPVTNLIDDGLKSFNI